MAAESRHPGLWLEGRGGQPYLGHEDRFVGLRRQFLQISLVGGTGYRARRRGAHSFGIGIDVEADQIAEIRVDGIGFRYFQVWAVYDRADMGPAGVAVEMPAAIPGQFVIHGPVDQPGQGDFRRGPVADRKMLTFVASYLWVAGIGPDHRIGLQFIADGKEHQPVRPPHLVDMVDGRFDVLHGLGQKRFGEKILLVGPDPDILPVDHIGLVQGGKEFRRHFHREDVEIVDGHVFHQAEMLFVAAVVAGRGAFQRGFLRQIGRIADALEKDRLVVPSIDNLTAFGHKPRQSDYRWTEQTSGAAA